MSSVMPVHCHSSNCPQTGHLRFFSQCPICVQQHFAAVLAVVYERRLEGDSISFRNDYSLTEQSLREVVLRSLSPDVRCSECRDIETISALYNLLETDCSSLTSFLRAMSPEQQSRIFMLVVNREDFVTLDQLLQENIFLTQNDRCSALSKVANNGNESLITSLLNKGPLTDLTKEAVIFGVLDNEHLNKDQQLNVINQLLKGLEFFSPESRGVAVKKAVEKEHLEVVAALLENGEITQQDWDLAAYRVLDSKRFDIVLELIVHGENFDAIIKKASKLAYENPGAIGSKNLLEVLGATADDSSD